MDSCYSLAMELSQFEILLRFRNAKRDAAFAKYGNDWRKYVHGNQYWNTEPQDDEERAHIAAVRAGKLS